MTIVNEDGRRRSDEKSDEFVARAIDGADINALRLALYQATGDESLLELPMTTTPLYSGAAQMAAVAPDAVPVIKAKATAFLLSGAATKDIETVPADAELRRLYENFNAEKLSDRDWAYRRDLGAFDPHPRRVEWTDGKPGLPAGFEVAVIGGGFGGIAIAVQLASLGIPFTLYEKRNELGGTWSRNTYPDVRVDTTNFMYQYFFEKNYPWTEYFARGAEVRAYLEHIAAKYGVLEHIEFSSELLSATFDESGGAWDLVIDAGGETKRVRAGVVVSATGLFSKPKRFDAAGVDDFTGTLIHTAECTGAERFDGLDVAVIGNGSTGVQMLSAVHAQAKSLDVYQRTPQWLSTKEHYGEPITPETRWLFDTMPYYWNWYCYSVATGRIYMPLTQEPDPAWQAKGGLVCEANDNLRVTLTSYIKSKLKRKPELADLLIPDYPPMARRLVVDNDWLATIDQDNVSLITESIERLTPNGIRTIDGTERRYDVILTATGFEVEKYLWPAQYSGLGGTCLEDVWEDPASEGPRAYLSITVPAFPNLYIMYGPNSQSRAGSLIVSIELWAQYIAKAIVYQLEGGHQSLVVRDEVFNEYNQRLDDASALLIWSHPEAKDRNYYVNPYGRQQVNAPWQLPDYHALFSTFNPDDYHIG
jgi:4-hydroxyacetophenone monooxygenase